MYPTQKGWRRWLPTLNTSLYNIHVLFRLVSFQRNEHNVLWNNIRKLWSHVAFKHILLQHTLRHGQGRTTLYLHMSCYYVPNCILWCLSSIHCFLFVVMTFQGCCINTYTIFVIQLIEIVLKCILLSQCRCFEYFSYIFLMCEHCTCCIQGCCKNVPRKMSEK